MLATDEGHLVCNPCLSLIIDSSPGTNGGRKRRGTSELKFNWKTVVETEVVIVDEVK